MSARSIWPRPAGPGFRVPQLLEKRAGTGEECVLRGL